MAKQSFRKSGVASQSSHGTPFSRPSPSSRLMAGGITWVLALAGTSPPIRPEWQVGRAGSMKIPKRKMLQGSSLTSGTYLGMSLHSPIPRGGIGPSTGLGCRRGCGGLRAEGFGTSSAAKFPRLRSHRRWANSREERTKAPTAENLYFVPSILGSRKTLINPREGSQPWPRQNGH